LYYCSGNGNFGDELNGILFEKIFNVKFNLVSNPLESDYAAIGSNLEAYMKAGGRHRLMQIIRNTINSVGIQKTKETIVLGSGFHFEPTHLEFLKKMRFEIVRGKLTEMVLRKNKFMTGEVLLGDLGILASYLHDSGNNEKKFELGVMPHFNDLNSPIFYDIYKKHTPYSILINVKDAPEKIIGEMARCESIVSSSLHGLIVADSLNIPNLWLENRYKWVDEEHRFKYQDYYSALDIADIYPTSAIDFLDYDVKHIKRSYEVDYDKVQKKQNELYDFCKKYFEENM
jgi:hypothetical protein